MGRPPRAPVVRYRSCRQRRSDSEPSGRRLDVRSQWLAMETAGADAVVPPRPSWRARLRPASARRRPRVELGPGVLIGRDVVLRAEPGARLVVEAGAALADGARLEARGGTLRVGAGAVLGERCVARGRRHRGARVRRRGLGARRGRAQLGDRARLAAHAVALDGARVAAGAVVASAVRRAVRRPVRRGCRRARRRPRRSGGPRRPSRTGARARSPARRGGRAARRR